MNSVLEGDPEDWLHEVRLNPALEQGFEDQDQHLLHEPLLNLVQGDQHQLHEALLNPCLVEKILVHLHTQLN